jgi:hypothetical protein
MTFNCFLIFFNFLGAAMPRTDAEHAKLDLNNLLCNINATCPLTCQDPLISGSVVFTLQFTTDCMLPEECFVECHCKKADVLRLQQKQIFPRLPEDRNKEKSTNQRNCKQDICTDTHFTGVKRSLQQLQ